MANNHFTFSKLYPTFSEFQSWVGYKVVRDYPGVFEAPYTLEWFYDRHMATYGESDLSWAIQLFHEKYYLMFVDIVSSFNREVQMKQYAIKDSEIKNWFKIGKTIIELNKSTIDVVRKAMSNPNQLDAVITDTLVNSAGKDIQTADIEKTTDEIKTNMLQALQSIKFEVLSLNIERWNTAFANLFVNGEYDFANGNVEVINIDAPQSLYDQVAQNTLDIAELKLEDIELQEQIDTDVIKAFNEKNELHPEFFYVEPVQQKVAVMDVYNEAIPTGDSKLVGYTMGLEARILDLETSSGGGTPYTDILILKDQPNEAIDGVALNQSTNNIATKTKFGTIDTRILGVEGVNTTQDTRLTALEAKPAPSTALVSVVNASTESITGTATNQQIINQEFRSVIANLQAESYISKIANYTLSITSAGNIDTHVPGTWTLTFTGGNLGDVMTSSWEEFDGIGGSIVMIINQNLVDPQTPVLVTSPDTSGSIKVTPNTFHGTKPSTTVQNYPLNNLSNFIYTDDKYLISIAGIEGQFSAPATAGRVLRLSIQAFLHPSFSKNKNKWSLEQENIFLKDLALEAGLITDKTGKKGKFE